MNRVVVLIRNACAAAVIVGAFFAAITQVYAQTTLQIPSTLSSGGEGYWVSQLQIFLRSTGDFIYPEITGYYGSVTEAAVKAYQCRLGIVCSGTPDSTGYGQLGPQTRLAVSAGRGFVTNIVTSNVIVPDIVSDADFQDSGFVLALTRVLYLGAEGEDVSQLQIFLRSTGDFIYPEITGYYGSVTEAAVKRYQARNNIVSTGDAASTGYGVVGPKTRASLLAQALRTKKTTTTNTFPIPDAQRASGESSSSDSNSDQELSETRTTGISASRVKACELDSITVSHGQSRTLYNRELVADGERCQSKVRTCQNGRFTDTAAEYQFESCTEAPRSCTAGGVTVSHGQTRTFYKSASVPAGEMCQSQQRTCNAGRMDGSYTEQSCFVESDKSSVVSSDGLVGHWKLDEGSGSSIKDHSGNNNDGTTYGTRWTSDHNNGKALDFDGESDYAKIPHSATLDITGPMTIEVWLNQHDKVFDDGQDRIITKGQNEAFQIHSNNTLYCFVVGPSGKNGACSRIADYNQWVQVAGVYDGVTEKLYINKKLVATSPADSSIPSTSDDIYIGSWDEAGRRFNGEIGEIKIWNRALSVDELQTESSSVINPNYDVYVLDNPIESVVSMPTPLDYQNKGLKDGKLAIRAARGEYEPASFVIRPKQDVTGVRIEASDLTKGSDRISKENIDIKLVKAWYQSGYEVTHRLEQGRFLVPELLLNDNELIDVDYENQANYLRVNKNGKDQYVDISTRGTAFPADVKIEHPTTLQPFDLQAKHGQQIWITVKVPSRAKAGVYSGHLTLTADDGSVRNIGFDVEVLPFDLPDPMLEYGIYYVGALNPDGDIPDFDPKWKTAKQYQAEIKNMKEHGVLYPTLRQTNFDLIDDELKLRKAVNSVQDSIHFMYRPWTLPLEAGDHELTRQVIRDWSAVAKSLGYKDIYFYGYDEAKGDKLLAQRPIFETMLDAGAKIFNSTALNSAGVIGDLLSKAILHGYNGERNDRVSGEIEEYHDNGQKVLMYSAPQGGHEGPLENRYRFGFWIWDMGYDGTMTWVWQWAFGSIWNDFDGLRNGELRRDKAFTYPVTDGMIDTIQWEAFREAVDDIRYLTALLETSPREAVWVSDMVNDGTNPAMIRDAIIDRLLELR